MTAQRVYLRGFAVRAEDADPADDGPIPFVLTTAGQKADGLDLQMDRLDLARYLANPVLMYGHDYWGREGLPIGRVDDPRIDGDRLLGGLVFDRNDPFAVKVEHKIRNRFLNAVSVGFDASNIGRDGIPETWTLFETSVVPLPMDPDAIADDGRALALARALGGLGDRAGKVLSAKNGGLVEDAITALQALLDAAAGPDDDDDPRSHQPGSGSRLAAARRRLQTLV